MSFSDSESSSHGGEYKFFRQISRDRLLHEMLGSAKADSKSWKVFIMDKVTVKVMSHSCKMADITDQGVSLVEDLFRRRQPLPSMDAVYFIRPTKENVVMFLSDMSGREPLYKKAYVFFSSPIPKELVNHIKNDTSVLPRIAALREMNLEYFPIDSQLNEREISRFVSPSCTSEDDSALFGKLGPAAIMDIISENIGFSDAMRKNLHVAFVTDHDRALEELFGQNAENSHKFDACLNTTAIRIATVFASLKEFPLVRYRSAKAVDASMTTFRDLIPTKLATAVWNCLEKYKSIPNFPQTETCELLILDRSVDQIAPVIHEWTYDAMCHDLLEMEGNKYVIEVPSKTNGQPEKKEILLEDHDPVWLELRHAHIADASERLHDRMTNFVSKNKAAQLQQNSRDGGEISTRDLQKIVQSLPQYSEQVDKLSLHVEIAGKINQIIRDIGLRELGQLEQDLVFGDAGAKDVINFLRTKQDATPENKLRLLMIYASVYPEKFEDDKASKLMQLARLSAEDMKIINNMRLLAGSSNSKKTSSDNFSLKFNGQKTKQARKDRTGEEETWQLFRFYPMIESNMIEEMTYKFSPDHILHIFPASDKYLLNEKELIENLYKGDLPKNEYSCMNDPSPTVQDANQTLSVRKTAASATPPPSERKAPAHSMRSRRTPSWAKPQNSDDGTSSDSILKQAPDFRKMGQRIFIFIIGGATRSELRVCHKLTTKLRREVVLGSTSFDDPPQHIMKLKQLSEEHPKGGPRF